MEEDLFDDLMASTSEAGAIHHGEGEPARITRHDDNSEILTAPGPRETRD